MTAQPSAKFYDPNQPIDQESGLPQEQVPMLTMT